MPKQFWLRTYVITGLHERVELMITVGEFSLYTFKIILK